MKIKYFDITQSALSIKCKLYSMDAHRFSHVVISVHGFGGSKDNNATQKLAETLLPVHKDAAILSFDLPCHGSDVKQKLDLEDCSRYLDTVVQYAGETLQAEHLLGFATSFGGYLLLKHLHDKGNPFDKILLRCPAVSMYDILLRDIEKSGQAALLPKKDAVLGFDRKIRIPARFLDQLRENDLNQWDFSEFTDSLLILQGTKDELVSHDMVEAFANAKGIDFLSIENADHRFREPSKMREVLDYTMELFFG